MQVNEKKKKKKGGEKEKERENDIQMKRTQILHFHQRYVVQQQHDSQRKEDVNMQLAIN